MNSIISRCSKLSIPFARLSLFVVYFWFGALKLFDLSPANPLVSDLLSKTLPFISFETFIVLLGLFEIVIGISFLFPKLLKFSVVLLVLHMITTIMPLILLPQVTWSAPFAPTLEGQYIIKNLLIIAVALSLISHKHREVELG